MSDRPLSKYAHDTATSRRLLLQEVREDRAKHGRPITVVWATYGTGSFNAAIVSEEVPGMLAEMERFVEADNHSVESIKSALFYSMRNNEHFGAGKGAAVHSLLWLLSRTPEVRELAEKGDCLLGYELRSRQLPDGAHGVEFCLVAERLEVDA